MSRRLLTAVLLAALASVSLAAPALAAPGDLPRLTGSVTVIPNDLDTPPGVQWFFDDHSIGGDNHMSWGNYTNSGGQTSQGESREVRFASALTVTGLGGLELCGYPSGAAGWMRAYQSAPGALAACPPTQPGSGQVGWFRYIYGNHGVYNRWHFMDLERFALVPTGTTANGTVPTVWDSHWGTCLAFDVDDACAPDPAAGSLTVGVSTGRTARTTPVDTADLNAQVPDNTVIPIRPEVGAQLPAVGTYQVVALTNPYALLAEAGGAIGSVRCVNVTIERRQYGDLETTVTSDNPPTCAVPAVLNAGLTGPGGVDPMAGAGPTTPPCTLIGYSHCWAAAPTSGSPNPAARTNATGDPGVTATIALAQNAQIPAALAATGRPAGLNAAPAPAGPKPATPSPKPPTSPISSARKRALAIAGTRTRSALRKVFGKGLSRLAVSCKLRSDGGSSCTVSWRKSSARYSGHVYLRTKKVNRKVRWQYRVDVTKRKNGKTTHVRRAYKTGGLVG